MEIEFAHAREYEHWPLVPALIINPQTGGQIEVNLVVDTGAESTVLDSSIAAALSLALGPRSGWLTGLGGSTPASTGEVEVMLLSEPALLVRVNAAFVTGIGENLGNLLGLDYFEHVNMGLSHSNRTLYFGLPA